MRVALSLTFLLSGMISAFPAFGQAREITQSDFKNLQTISADKQKGLPRREKATTTRGDDQGKSESILEYAPDGTYHYVGFRRENGVETKTEWIRIGSVHYYRLQDGTWSKDPPPRGLSAGSGAGSGSGMGIAPPVIKESYLYVGKDNINGQQTAHYRTARVITYMSRTTRTVVDYWFREDGLIVKEIYDNAVENSKSSYTTVTEYEYDKAINIKAPIPE